MDGIEVMSLEDAWEVLGGEPSDGCISDASPDEFAALLEKQDVGAR